MSDASTGDLLSLSGLTVERGGRVVVRDVTLEIAAGEVTALLGPNGAGKSSLVLAVGGVLRTEAARSRWATASSPASAPSGSGRPESRSSPRAGGCSGS